MSLTLADWQQIFSILTNIDVFVFFSVLSCWSFHLDNSINRAEVGVGIGEIRFFHLKFRR